MLVVMTGLFLFYLIPSGKLDFAKEWSIIPLLALPWVIWVHSVLKYRRHRAGHADYERSIQASFQAILDENRISRRRMKIVGFVQLGAHLLLPLIVSQLKAVGKAGDEINAMFVLFPALFGCVLLGMIYHYRCRLLPRKQEIETLLSSYESDAPA